MRYFYCIGIVQLLKLTLNKKYENKITYPSSNVRKFIGLHNFLIYFKDISVGISKASPQTNGATGILQNEAFIKPNSSGACSFESQ